MRRRHAQAGSAFPERLHYPGVSRASRRPTTLHYPQTMAMSRKTVRLLAYGAIYVFWGGSFLAIRDMVAVTPPFFSAAIRFFLAGVALYAFSRWRGGTPVRGRALWNSLSIGVLLFTISYGCLFWAETRIASGTAAVMAATIPIWILLGEVAFLRIQRLTLAIAGATLLGITGVCLVTRSIGLRAFHAERRAGRVIRLDGLLLCDTVEPRARPARRSGAARRAADGARQRGTVCPRGDCRRAAADSGSTGGVAVAHRGLATRTW